MDGWGKREGTRRGVLSELGRGRQSWETGAKARARSQLRLGEGEHSGEGGEEQMKARSVQGQWRGGRENSSHPRRLLSRWHLTTVA